MRSTSTVTYVWVGFLRYRTWYLYLDNHNYTERETLLVKYPPPSLCSAFLATASLSSSSPLLRCGAPIRWRVLKTSYCARGCGLPRATMPTPFQASAPIACACPVRPIADHGCPCTEQPTKVYRKAAAAPVEEVREGGNWALVVNWLGRQLLLLSSSMSL